MKNDWEFSTIGESALEREKDILLGLRLALVTGFHHGWLRLTRPVVDSHTPFEVTGAAFHPVPGEPIIAGEAPPLPPIQHLLDPEGLALWWDVRWGNLLLETADHLDPPVVWEPVVVAAGGPITVAGGEESRRFYRLRVPP